jgi:AraC-like DNA-binding protein
MAEVHQDEAIDRREPPTRRCLGFHRHHWHATNPSILRRGPASCLSPGFHLPVRNEMMSPAVALRNADIGVRGRRFQDCYERGQDTRTDPDVPRGQVQLNRATQRHATIIARFLDAVEKHDGEAFRVSELCAKIGVPSRTLRNCFSSNLGVGPKKYLYLRRMHLARLALLGADAGVTNVTETATQFGFWQLGHFAVAYKRLFGESPSQTLHGGGTAAAGGGQPAPRELPYPARCSEGPPPAPPGVGGARHPC